ncbi:MULTISPECIES: ribonuclease E inhibitor RraB [Bacillaceae]|uniref:ribonuclease E inhibitor RraB n=1 Tax=Bacillaceae TaxID=186817 RepID=UPI001E63689F|nr:MULTISPECIES: ribonuclease E inhibitor RraB [Bacillaceae]MCE4051402.1 ribonuclease E inhibitor RraB [Bacillus sp. Au-Bac7]UPO89986.1 ribonuclease E inhibitor RraB [Niallia sp. Man26]
MVFFRKRKFPKDEDGDVLHELDKYGCDFSVEQTVEFVIDVPNENSGKQVLEELKTEGYRCEMDYDEEEDMWTVYCFIEMMLTYEGIVEVQNKLRDLIHPLDGEIDGWGVGIE